MSYTVSVAEFAAFTRSLALCADVPSTLDAIVRFAVQLPGVEHLTIAVPARNGRGYETAAATGDIARCVDAIQHRVREGPSLTALQELPVVRADDLATDPRWPRFARIAADETPISSVMSQRLHLGPDTVLGVLALYSCMPAAFAELDVAALDALAAQAAAAMATAAIRDQNDHLTAALESNRQIGVAIGILMRTHRITTDQGFDVLKVASQRLHRKLRDIALYVADAGELPPIPASNEERS